VEPKFRGLFATTRGERVVVRFDFAGLAANGLRSAAAPELHSWGIGDLPGKGYP